MTPRTRGTIVGLSGFFVGAATARIFPWSTLPKAVLVGIVAASVSTVALIALRLWAPQTGHGRGP